MQKIYLEPKEKRNLARIFSCSLKWIHVALNGESESDSALRIRQKALQMGGVKIPKRKQEIMNYETTLGVSQL